MFKVGDKVRRVTEGFSDIVKGNTYTVKCIGNTRVWLEESSNNYFYHVEGFELVKNDLKIKFQLDDKVRLKGGQDIWTVTGIGTKDLYIRLNDRLAIEVYNSQVELVERPKKLVTKTFEAWMNVYSNGVTNISTTEAKANNLAQWNGKDRIACVKLTGTAEVPE